MEHAAVTGGGDTVDIEDHVASLCIMMNAKLIQFPQASGSQIYDVIMAEDRKVADALEEYRTENRGRSLMPARRGTPARVMQFDE